MRTYVFLCPEEEDMPDGDSMYAFFWIRQLNTARHVDSCRFKQ